MRQRRGALLLLALALALLGSSCASSVGPVACGDSACASATSTARAYTPAVCAAVACAAGHGVQVFVEPDAGEAPILHAIQSANRSIWVEVCAPSNGHP